MAYIPTGKPRGRPCRKAGVSIREYSEISPGALDNRRPEKENLLSGFFNLENGLPAAEPPPTYYLSLKAAAIALGIDASILREARILCPAAFLTNGAIHHRKITDWLEARREGKLFAPVNPPLIPYSAQPPPASVIPASADEPEYEEDDYTINEESTGVGRTLKSLETYERYLKKKLDEVHKAKGLHPAVKEDLINKARKAWMAVNAQLLNYDVKVITARRDSGELIPVSEAIQGVAALLAWHTIASSDTLRTIIPDLEGRNKFQIAKILDPALRSAIYRNFEKALELKKLPEWMAKAAIEFIRNEKPLTLEPEEGK